MTDLAVDRLILRGPGGRQLADVAARHLPAALDRAFADVDDVVLDRVTVRLPLDPSAYDGQTLATLWADAIRKEVLASGVGVRRNTSDASRDDHPGRGEERARPRASEIADLAATWSSSGGSPGPIPRALLGLGDRRVAAHVAASMGPESWRRLLGQLAETLGTDGDIEDPRGRTEPTASDRIGHEPTSEPAARTAPKPAAEGAQGEEQGAASASDRVTADNGGALIHAEEDEVLHRLEVLAELAGDGTGPIEVTSLTRAAGLALLWPWLADLCREVERREADSEPFLLRARALAHLADPDRPDLVDDPFVRLLAGVSEGESVTPTTRPSEGLVAATDRVLAAFAVLLPGFGDSSGRFVRDEWVLRQGTLDMSDSPVALVAATHPLDVLLPALPYPVSLFKLPWSEPVSVRFRP